MASGASNYTVNAVEDYSMESGYLLKIYAILSTALLLSAVGGYMHLEGMLSGGIVTAVIALICILLLHFYGGNDCSHRLLFRMALFFTFAFCSGQTLGPMIQYSISKGENNLSNALKLTAVSTICLTLLALFSEPGKFLFMGPILSRTVNSIAIISIINIYFQSNLMHQMHLYIGILVMAGYIIYDTQIIMERSRGTDAVQDAMDLFFNITMVFRRLLIAFTSRAEAHMEAEEAKK